MRALRRAERATALPRPQDLQSLRVLFVEDSEEDVELLAHELRRGGYEPVHERVETAAAMIATLLRAPWDVVIADHDMPRFNAPSALAVLHRMGLDLPFIIVSGRIGEEIAVAAMKAGAHDYLTKSALARLVPAVERELREAEVRRQRQHATAGQQEEAQVSAALARVARELISLLDTPLILQRLCQLATEVLGCECSHTLLWQPKDDEYVLISSYGDPPEKSEFLRALRLPRDVLLELLGRLDREDAVYLEQSESARRLFPPLDPEFGLTAVLCMPLRRGREIVGIQTAASRAWPQPVTPQQRRIAQGIAQLGSMALENARLVEALDRASRLKSEFVATMSHELRTPLNVIIGYNDLLLDGEFRSVTPEQAEVLERIRSNARNLLDLVNATLDLSRLDAGRVPLDMREVSLPDLCRELDSDTRELRAKPGLSVAWNLASHLPPLYTDAMKLKVIVKNLITNAIKFTDAGSVTVTVAPRNGGVEIAVTDTGIGMAPEALPIIFEPFRQADSSPTRRYGGVGLGLYVVRRLLGILGGSISVDSEVGRGSTFRVWVPRDLRAASGLSWPDRPRDESPVP